MSDVNDGGPAFPFGQISEITGQPINGYFAPGMTLRDWFAGQALAGMLANPHTWTEEDLEGAAYRYADAMLRARGVKP